MYHKRFFIFFLLITFRPLLFAENSDYAPLPEMDSLITKWTEQLQNSDVPYQLIKEGDFIEPPPGHDSLRENKTFLKIIKLTPHISETETEITPGPSSGIVFPYFLNRSFISINDKRPKLVKDTPIQDSNRCNLTEREYISLGMKDSESNSNTLVIFGESGQSRLPSLNSLEKLRKSNDASLDSDKNCQITLNELPNVTRNNDHPRPYEWKNISDTFTDQKESIFTLGNNTHRLFQTKRTETKDFLLRYFEYSTLFNIADCKREKRVPSSKEEAILKESPHRLDLNLYGLKSNISGSDYGEDASPVPLVDENELNVVQKDIPIDVVATANKINIHSKNVHCKELDKDLSLRSNIAITDCVRNYTKYINSDLNDSNLSEFDKARIREIRLSNLPEKDRSLASFTITTLGEQRRNTKNMNRVGQVILNRLERCQKINSECEMIDVTHQHVKESGIYNFTVNNGSDGNLSKTLGTMNNTSEYIYEKMNKYIAETYSTYSSDSSNFIGPDGTKIYHYMTHSIYETSPPSWTRNCSACYISSSGTCSTTTNKNVDDHVYLYGPNCNPGQPKPVVSTLDNDKYCKFTDCSYYEES